MWSPRAADSVCSLPRACGQGNRICVNKTGISLLLDSVRSVNDSYLFTHMRLPWPCRPEVVSKRHYHEVDFQMVYVLKGWIKTELDGQGAIVMRAGSCWLQPPRIEHAVLDYSDDCEVLEIGLPADFKTVELA